ncbi:MAG: DUF4174 domain-containing protein [Leptolyngbya sp. SIO3F4]|nr:DUF4174 domain-containing protein [Leptolyngbya sp. SIO3F4]
MLSTLMMLGHGQASNVAKLTMKDATNVGALMEDHQWQDRVLLIFAPDSDDADLTEQTANLSGRGAGLRARDLVVWQLINNGSASVNNEVDTDLSSQSFYDYFSVKEAEFTVILLGKDGTTKLRQTQPVTTNRLFAVIDAMPMRQREMRERGQ